MPRCRNALAVLLPAVLLGGCGSSAEPTRPPIGARFEVSLELSSSSLAPGEPLQFTHVLTNTGDRNGVLQFSSGCMTNFIVRDENGVIWDELAMGGMVCTLDTPTMEIAPGQSRTWTDTWKQGTASGPAPPGDYRIEAHVLSAPALPVSEATFAIRSSP